MEMQKQAKVAAKKEEVKGAKASEPLVIDGVTVPEDPAARAQWIEDQRAAYIAKMQTGLKRAEAAKGDIFQIKMMKQRITLA